MMPTSDPLPEPGSRSVTRSSSCHLLCGCQLRAAPPRLTLCGIDADREAVRHACPPGGCHAPCAVCLDLGPAVVAARRCERCPS